MPVSFNQAAYRLGFESLYFSGAHIMLRPLVGGVGAFLTLHHVRPERPDAFQPNRGLEVTPTFLDRLMRKVRGSRLDIVSVDEVHRRLTERDFSRRFICLTIDDGYRDTLEQAYPILKKYDAPFAVYIATSFPDRLGELWWLALEAVIARNHRIGLVIDGKERFFDCRTLGDKRHLFSQIYWWLRSMKTEDEVRTTVRDLASRYGVDLGSFSNELCMRWDEIGSLASDPLVTIGAHTVNHFILTKVPEQTVRTEMQMSQAVIEASLGKKPLHFAYPFGDRPSAGLREFRVAAELGFKTAVTTRPGVLFPEHREQLFALPRLSLNGNFQQMRYARVLLSGVPTAFARGFRRVDKAA